MENFRHAIGLRIKEIEEVYKGKITPVNSENSDSVKIYINMYFIKTIF